MDHDTIERRLRPARGCTWCSAMCSASRPRDDAPRNPARALAQDLYHENSIAARARDVCDSIRRQERVDDARVEDDVRRRVHLRAHGAPPLEDDGVVEPRGALVVSQLE